MIYSNREYQNLATKERVLFTDSYAVRFWWLEPGTEFARPHEVIYHTNGQDQHEQIQAGAGNRTIPPAGWFASAISERSLLCTFLPRSSLASYSKRNRCY